MPLLEKEQSFGAFLGIHERQNTVLVLAGVDLIFFIVAIMNLCFGFALETALIIQGCLSHC